MILIISVENDPSTDDVIRWLFHFKKDFIRVNPSNHVIIDRCFISSREKNITLSFKHIEKQVLLANINSYWYRRGDVILKENGKPSNEVDFYLEVYLSKELKVIEEYIHSTLEEKFHINKRIDNETNKLLNLKRAAECGFEIPSTWLIHANNKVYNTDIKNHNHITKGFRSSGFQIDNTSIGSHTTRIDVRKIDTLFPSNIQNEIRKAYELRVFYVHGEFYAVAIFSQQSEQTSVDFRNYNRKQPNRSVPYKLPVEVKEKLKLFMEKANLNCGSIDLIVTPENDYIFIEVNPVGQFQQVSIPGNYYLEKVIAEHLINKNGEKD